MTVFFLLIIGGSYLLIKSLNRYEIVQLKTYGQIQKVKIKEIRYKGKGTPYAFFDFYLEGKIYSKDLSPKDFNVGDSIRIIFSTADPNIVRYADDINSIKQ